MPLPDPNEVYRGPFFSVADETLIDPEGVKIRRVTVRHPGGAAALPVDPKGRILLVRQYRHAALDYLWELPAGRIDAGEKPLQTAKRELAEETGYRAARWKKLTMIYPSPGMLDERLHLYLATRLRETGRLAQHEEEDERVTLRWFTAGELDALIAKGKLLDGKTLCAYLIWRRFAKKESRA